MSALARLLVLPEFGQGAGTRVGQAARLFTKSL
jgi:hypothetical protein